MSAADQRVIAAASVVEHVEGVAIQSIDGILDAAEGVIAAVLMVRKGPGLGIRDKLWHGLPPSVRMIALPQSGKKQRFKSCWRTDYGAMTVM
jgi:hypothetical protein